MSAKETKTTQKPERPLPKNTRTISLTITALLVVAFACVVVWLTQIMGSIPSVLAFLCGIGIAAVAAIFSTCLLFLVPNDKKVSKTSTKSPKSREAVLPVPASPRETTPVEEFVEEVTAPSVAPKPGVFHPLRSRQGETATEPDPESVSVGVEEIPVLGAIIMKLRSTSGEKSEGEFTDFPETSLDTVEDSTTELTDSFTGESEVEEPVAMLPVFVPEPEAPVIASETETVEVEEAVDLESEPMSDQDQGEPVSDLVENEATVELTPEPVEEPEPEESPTPEPDTPLAKG